MFVKYNGPPDQVNFDVMLALREQREDVEIELPDTRDWTPDDATVIATDAPPVSGRLEPGQIYDLPQELAQQLLTTTPWWEVAVTDYSKLSKTALAKLAKERAVAGYTKMSQEELVEALRASSTPPAPTTPGGNA